MEAARQTVRIAQGVNEASIKAPIESIDLAAWFFTLTNEEYAACSPGHNGMVQGRITNAKRASVSVETIGGNFIVNNFIEDISSRSRVRAVSDTTMWIGLPEGVRTLQARVTWELEVAPVSAQSCKLTNKVSADTEDLELVSRLQNVRRGDSNPTRDHFVDETPRFAADIERKALAGSFGRSG